MHGTLTKPAIDRWNAAAQLEDLVLDRLRDTTDPRDQRTALIVLRAAHVAQADHCQTGVDSQQAHLEADIAHMLSDLAAIRAGDWPAPTNELATILVEDGHLSEDVTTTLTRHDATPAELADAYLNLATTLAAIGMKSSVAETLAKVWHHHAHKPSTDLHTVTA